MLLKNIHILNCNQKPIVNEVIHMEILNVSREMSTEDKYFLTMSPEIEKMSSIKGMVLEIDCWILYKDQKTDEDGKVEEETILSIRNTLGEVYATNSPTFIKEFERIIELFNDDGQEVKYIKVSSGTSKNGRDYITCVYTNSLE